MSDIAQMSYAEIGRFAAIPFSFIEGSKQLSFHARWLFVALVYYRNTRTGDAFPSYDTIGGLTGLRREMISKAIKELESGEAGWVWLERKKRFSKSTIYTLRFPDLSSMYDTPEDECPF